MLVEDTFAAEVAARLGVGTAAWRRLLDLVPPDPAVAAVGFRPPPAPDAQPVRRLVAFTSPGRDRPSASGSAGGLRVVADPAALPIATGACDAAVSVGALESAPDPAAVVRELARVVVPGGPVVVAEVDWASLVWEHPNRPLTELIRQAALRRVAPAPYRARETMAWLRAAPVDATRVDPLPLVETGRGAVLLRLAERAANWAINGARCPAPAANAWLEDLRDAANHGAFLATISAYLYTAERSYD